MLHSFWKTDSNWAKKQKLSWNSNSMGFYFATYHLQLHVISKCFELQQRDCTQMKDLSKQIKKLIRFFFIISSESWLMVVSRWTKTFALGGTYMIPPWPTHARERLFRDNCFSYTRELRLLMNIFYIKKNAVDTGRTSIMHLNWPWIGVLFTHSLAPLTPLPALHCSLCSRAPQPTFIC